MYFYHSHFRKKETEAEQVGGPDTVGGCLALVHKSVPRVKALCVTVGKGCHAMPSPDLTSWGEGRGPTDSAQHTRQSVIAVGSRASALGLSQGNGN